MTPRVIPTRNSLTAGGFLFTRIRKRAGVATCSFVVLGSDLFHFFALGAGREVEVAIYLVVEVVAVTGNKTAVFTGDVIRELHLFFAVLGGIEDTVHIREVAIACCP